MVIVYVHVRAITVYKSHSYWSYRLCLLNIAMENGPFIDGLPGFTY